MKLYLLLERSDGSAVFTDDPDVPRLRLARAELAVAVEREQITPLSACEVLGKLADNLIINRKLSEPTWSKRLSL